jgi:hypothetical protein
MLDLLALMAEQAAAEAAAAAAAEAAASTAATEVAASAIPEMAASAMPEMAASSSMPSVGGGEQPGPMGDVGGNLGLMDLIAPKQITAPLPQASFGQQMGNVANSALQQQIQPAQNLFNTVINPQSTAGDIGRSAFEYSIKQKDEPDMTPRMSPYSNPYSGMAGNTVGGIPSLLQNTQSGLLPFFGAR